MKPYEVGEDVLVESEHGSLLWEASVTGISKKKIGSSDALVIDSYRVEYKDWPSHFTEWVEPNRVVEPNENNRLLQVRIILFTSYGMGTLTRRESISCNLSLQFRAFHLFADRRNFLKSEPRLVVAFPQH